MHLESKIVLDVSWGAQVFYTAHYSGGFLSKLAEFEVYHMYLEQLSPSMRLVLMCNDVIVFQRLLEENYHLCLERQFEEAEYIAKLAETDEKLKATLESKVKDIDRKRDDLIAHVKKTAGKLKFTLKGSGAG